MISIIVPIYNVEKFLPKCIESLINQTCRDIEIILVDDGSLDNSGVICDEFSKRDSRIIVIHQKNAGVSAARNAGMEIAKGQYIGFCDPDDYLSQNMYEAMHDAMQKHDADLVACGYNYYSENYEIDTKRIYKESPDEILDARDLYSKLSDMPPTIRHGVVTKLFRRDLIGNIRFNESLHSAEDLNFILDYISNVSKCIFVHKPLYNNLVRSGSATHGGLHTDSLQDSFYVHDRMCYETIKNFPELRSKAMAFLMDVCTLKYNESKHKSDIAIEDKSAINKMRKYLKRKSLTALFSKDIRFKTKIYYFLLWIRK